MTWYGITDFRTLLGLKQSTEPVLGALLAEDYAGVIILGFTQTDKSKNKTDVFQQKIDNIKNSAPAARDFIDLFSHSAEAKNHFSQWL